MKMEGNITNVEIKTELEETNSQDVIVPASASPECSSNGSSLKNPQETEMKENQGHKRKKPLEGLTSKKPRETANNSSDGSEDDSDSGEYCMIISEVSKLMVVDKLLKECRIILSSKEKIDKHQVKLTFRKAEDVLKLQHKLNEGGLNCKVVAMPPGQDGAITDNASDTTEVLPESLWKPDEEEDDPLGLYGLRLEFLKSLNITPPLDRWVHVSNFRCDKHELRDVMEMAGRVLSCSVVHINKKYAKVQYSHPLEAVQAVSMLNDQLFYGQKLKVYLERNPNNDLMLPKGLANVGLGLGLKGRPIRDVERQYEKYTGREKSSLNPTLFRRSNNADDGLLDYEEFMASVNERSFTVKQVIEHDSTGSGLSHTAKMSCSPDANSQPSENSPASTNDDKDFDKSREFNKTLVLTNLQPEVPGSTDPIIQTTNESCLNKITTTSVRSHVPSTSFRPGPPGTQIQAPPLPSLPPLPPSNQYPGAIRPGPTNIHHPMPIPSTSNPLAYSQPFKPQMPGVGPGPVNRPGPVYGTGPIQGSGPARGPGQIPAPGLNHAPGPIHGSIPVQGPRPGQAAGPTFGPGFARGPAPDSMSAPGPMKLPNSRVTVQLSNLPPSTTFPLLCERLAHCGQVLSLQFTTPGCAIVTFGHLSHAQKCFQTYSGMTVEGYTIVVQFL